MNSTYPCYLDHAFKVKQLRTICAFSAQRVIIHLIHQTHRYVYQLLFNINYSVNNVLKMQIAQEEILHGLAKDTGGQLILVHNYMHALPLRLAWVA